jgi:hypothetical protein
MSETTFPPARDRRLTGIAVTVLLHLALLWGWDVSMRVPVEPDTQRSAITWIDVPLPRPAPKPVQKPVARPVTTAPAQAAAMPRPRKRAPETPPAPMTVVEPMLEAPDAPAPPPSPSAADMLAQAKRDIGKFDKELRKEFATRGISKPADSPQIRLAQGIEDAYDAVPPKWYQSAKIKEIIDPGQYGRKRYRITTAFGTFCMTYESPNSPTALLDPSKRVEPKMTNCPPNEQPATTQKW